MSNLLNPSECLGLGLALASVRVDLDKLKKIVECPPLLQENSTLHYALNGFLAKGSPDMPHRLFGALISEFHVGPHDILPDSPVQETAPEWSASIEIKGDRLKLTVSHNGEELVYGKSYVQDTDNLGMMQAISYAAHMCYKMVQQRNM